MSTFSKKKFSERLQSQRIAAGYKRQQDLADAVGISVQSVSYYENEMRVPDAEVLSKIARAIGCTSDYLLQLENVTTREKASVANQIGLSEQAITVLESIFEKTKNEPDNHDLGEHPLDLINFILESDALNALLYTYGRLFYVMDINSFVGLSSETTASSEEAERLDYEAALHSLTIINTKDAIDFYIRKLGSLISQTIYDGIQRRIDDGTYLEKLFNMVEAIHNGQH